MYVLGGSDAQELLESTPLALASLSERGLGRGAVKVDMELGELGERERTYCSFTGTTLAPERL